MTFIQYFFLSKVHVVMDSEVADRCQSFALSDPDNGLFQKKCNHDHVEIFCECYKLNEVLADIEIACSKLVSEEERQDTMCMFQQAKDDVMAWKAHQLRIKQNLMSQTPLTAIQHYWSYCYLFW